jgi:hypothetical protein
MEPIRLRIPVNPTKLRKKPESGLGATFADALRTGPAKRDEPVDPKGSICSCQWYAWLSVITVRYPVFRRRALGRSVHVHGSGVWGNRY